ncbi:MAG: hypothetical protein AAGI46_01920 [Planctomycetota bacterium]
MWRSGLLMLALALPTSAALQDAPFIVEAREQLVEARQPLRDRGLPLTPAAFDAKYTAVDDRLNAAVPIMAAVEAMKQIDQEAVDRWKGLQAFDAFFYPLLPGERPLPSIIESDFRFTWDQVAEAHAPYLAALSELDALDGVARPAVDRMIADFGVRWDDPEITFLIDVLLVHLSDVRSLEQPLAWQTLIHTENGKSVEAFVSARRLFAVAESLSTSHPSTPSHLTGLGMAGTAAETLGRALPHLEFGPDGIEPKEARAFVDALLDRSAGERQWNGIMEAGILFQQHTVDQLLAGQAPPDYWDLGNQLRLIATAGGSGEVLVDAMLPLLDIGKQKRWPAARELVEQHEAVATRISDNRMKFDLASKLLPRFRPIAKSHFEAQNDRHRTAVALAIALYRADHDAVPPTLEALVPEYLPFVPPDVMTVDATVRYDQQRGLVWTVGGDGVDHDGFSKTDRLRLLPSATREELEAMGWDEVVAVAVPN